MGPRTRVLRIALLIACLSALVGLLAWRGQATGREQLPSAPTGARDRAAAGGRTTQGEPITAVVRDGRLLGFDTRLRLTCMAVGEEPSRLMTLPWRASVPTRGSDGSPTFSRGQTIWQYTWRPVLGPGSTIVDGGSVPPVNTAESLPLAPNGATSIVTAAVEGDSVTGTLRASVAMEGIATCEASGIRFRLPL